MLLFSIYIDNYSSYFSCRNQIFTLNQILLIHVSVVIITTKPTMIDEKIGIKNFLRLYYQEYQAASALPMHFRI